MASHNSKVRWIHAGTYLLQTILVLVFLLQGFLAYCLIAYNRIPLPANKVNQWLKESAHQGYYLQGKTCFLLPTGAIQFNELRAFVKSSDTAVAEAKELRLYPTFGQPFFRKVLLYQGTLYPTEKVETKDRPLGRLTDLNFALKWDALNETLHFEFLTARYQNLRICGNATLHPADLQNLTLGEPKRNDSLTPPLNHSETYSQLEQLLQKTRGPVLYLKLKKNTSANGISSASYALSFFFDALKFQGEHFAIQQLQLQGGASLKAKNFQLNQPLRFQAQESFFPAQGIRIEGLAGKIPEQSAFALREDKLPNCQIYADAISGFGKIIHAVELKTNHSSAGILQVAAAGKGFDGFLRFYSQLHLDDYSGNGTLSGNFNPLRLIPEFQTYKIPKSKINGSSLCKARIYWQPHFQQPQLQAFAHFSQPNLNGVSFDHASFNAAYYANNLAVDSFRFKRGSQWLELDYHLNLKEKIYALSTRGRVLPDQYNPFMPRWWQQIFNKDLTFSELSHVEGDCVVYGHLSRKTADFYYGKFNATQIAYRQVPIDHGHLTLRGKDRYVEIHSLDAHSDSHRLYGDLQFTQYRDKIHHLAAIRYDLNGSLPLSKIRKLLPTETATKLEIFQSLHATKFNFKAAQFREADYPQFLGHSHLQLEVVADAPLTFHSADLDYLRFKLHAQKNKMYIRDLHFGLGGGEGTGMIDHERPSLDEPAELCAKLKLQDADYPYFRSFITKLESNQETPASSSNSMPSSQSSSLNLKIHTLGPANNLYAHFGYGNFEIQDQDLSSIQLLGPLSMILEKTPLGFTSLRLSQIESDFAIEDGFMKFSPLNINGPQANIEANGTLHLENKSLDILVGINLIGNLSKRINPFKRITDVINPLNYLMQFRITGKLDDQEIRSLYDPRNLLP
ncbi:MAG: Uncharacterised protein [Opitutia bacterium UBA7350]|nr:MAG: Uncharacterised protein [Opitutae bacterium UBA7350]